AAVLPFVQAHRRNPHLVARLEPGLGPRPTAVPPHLAAAHGPVDPRPPGAPGPAPPEVVEPLSGASGVDRDEADAAARSGPGRGVIHGRVYLIHSRREIRC